MLLEIPHTSWVIMDSVFDAEAFIQKFKDELEVPADIAVDLNSRLVEDLDFDSLQMMLTLEWLSELLPDGVQVGDEQEVLDALVSVRSAHAYYLTRSSMPAEEDRPTAPLGVGSPVLRGRLVSLMAPLGNHYARLYEIAISNEIAWRWRYGGSIPSYDEFLRTFSSGVLTQLVITRPDNEQAMGLVVAYNANLQNRTAYLAVVVSRELVGSGAGIEGAMLFIRHLIRTCEFEKIYIETPEFNVAQFGSGLDKYFKLEGHLKSHSYFVGRRWDQLIFAVYRDDVLMRWFQENECGR